MRHRRNQNLFAAMVLQSPWAQVLLESEDLRQGYPWLAMDANNKLYVYSSKPRVGSNIWISFDGRFLFVGQLADSGQSLDFTECCLSLGVLQRKQQADLRSASPGVLPDLPEACGPDAWL